MERRDRRCGRGRIATSEGAEQVSRENLAARAGRWSAHNRKKAIWGWIAFVVLATVLGGAVGMNKMAQEDLGNGESRTADRAVAAAGFPDDADEQVLVQAKGSGTVRDANVRAAVRDAVSRLEVTRHVSDVKDPFAEGNAGQISKDGRSALVTFKVSGDDELSEKHVGAALAT